MIASPAGLLQSAVFSILANFEKPKGSRSSYIHTQMRLRACAPALWFMDLKKCQVSQPTGNLATLTTTVSVLCRVLCRDGVRKILGIGY